MGDFTAITVGIGTYRNNPAWDIDEASAARDKVAKLLSAHGAVVEDHSNDAASKGSIHSFLEDLRSRRTWSGVLYWTGHATYSDSDGYLLALGDSGNPLTDDNALTGRSLASAVAQHRQTAETEGADDAWLLVILDTCRSQQGAWHVWQRTRELLRDAPRNCGVIGTADGDGTAVAGRFADLLERKLTGFSGNDADGIVIGELVRRMLEAGPEGHLLAGAQVHHAFPPGARLRLPEGSPPALTSTVADDTELRRVLASAAPTVRNHYYAKAQGSEVTQPAWHFTGRTTERRQLTAWLNTATSGMRVVTGVAGSGKSALLGMLLASSDPEIVAALEKLGYPKIPPSASPGPGVFTAVTHLSGRTIGDVITNLSDQLPEPPAQRGDADAYIEQLGRAAAGRPPYTILADAVDESRDPYTIAAFLRRLAHAPHVRVLVGTRQSVHETPDHPSPPDDFLLHALTTDEALITRLARDENAIYEYTRSRLATNLPPEPEREKLADRLADTIAAVDQPFLFARLAVYEILANPGWQHPDAPLDELLRHGHSGIFDISVARIKKADPTAEALLHALAYARGNGFPRTDGVWAAAAAAFTKRVVTDDDVERTLNLAAPYIMQDSEFGNAVYRLAHRTFTEHYQAHDHTANLPG